MKKIINVLCLILIVSFLIPDNFVFASSDSYNSDYSYETDDTGDSDYVYSTDESSDSDDSTDSDYIDYTTLKDYVKGLSIVPKHDTLEPGSDSLYYGYIYLDQHFRPNLLNYTTTVKNHVKIVKVAARIEGNVTVTGEKDYELEVGANTITIVATTPDGISKTYTIVIDRLGSKDDNANLGSILINDNKNNYYLDEFDTRVTNYNIVVGNDITEMDIYGRTEVYTSKVTGNDIYKLKVGENKFVLTVTSKSGRQKSYIININRKKSADVSLISINVNGDNVFEYGKKNLTVHVLYDTSTVDINAATFSNVAKIEGAGKHKVKVGSNNFKLAVIAENGKEDVYNIKIIREKPTTALSDLEINQYICGTEGSKVSLDVNNSTDKAVISAKAVDKSAKVTGNGTYKLKVGKNTFYVTVRAADGKTKRYTVTINRSKYKDIKIIIIWN